MQYPSAGPSPEPSSTPLSRVIERPFTASLQDFQAAAEEVSSGSAKPSGPDLKAALFGLLIRDDLLLPERKYAGIIRFGRKFSVDPLKESPGSLSGKKIGQVEIMNPEDVPEAVVECHNRLALLGKIIGAAIDKDKSVWEELKPVFAAAAKGITHLTIVADAGDDAPLNAVTWPLPVVLLSMAKSMRSVDAHKEVVVDVWSMVGGGETTEKDYRTQTFGYAALEVLRDAFERNSARMDAILKPFAEAGPEAVAERFKLDPENLPWHRLPLSAEAILPFAEVEFERQLIGKPGGPLVVPESSWGAEKLSELLSGERYPQSEPLPVLVATLSAALLRDPHFFPFQPLAKQITAYASRPEPGAKWLAPLLERLPEEDRKAHAHSILDAHPVAEAGPKEAVSRAYAIFLCKNILSADELEERILGALNDFKNVIEGYDRKRWADYRVRGMAGPDAWVKEPLSLAETKGVTLQLKKLDAALDNSSVFASIAAFSTMMSLTESALALPPKRVEAVLQAIWDMSWPEMKANIGWTVAVAQPAVLLSLTKGEEDPWVLERLAKTLCVQVSERFLAFYGPPDKSNF